MRILMRAGKSPLENIGPGETIKRNLIASNSGNLLFAQSVYKSLYRPDNEIDVFGYKPPDNPDYINENYDAFVLPLANAFRGSFEKTLRAYTDLIKKLRIRVVVVGVGAQTDLSHSQLDGSPIDDSVKEFVSAVLDRSDSIGVRGEYTRAYLNKLGFSAVETIGCPSMYLNGINLKVEKKIEALSSESLIAFNITPRKPAHVSDLFLRTFRDYKNSIYVPQDMDDAHLMMSGRKIHKIPAGDALPMALSNPMMKSLRSVMFTDVPTWIDFMRDRVFSFGTRIHGNVFALLAGTPAVVIAHDSRTLELAEYYEIPHIRTDEITGATTAASIYEEADFGPMMNGHARRFDKFKEFLDKNSLPHAYEGGRVQNEYFDDKVREQEFVGRIEVSRSALAELSKDDTPVRFPGDLSLERIVDLARKVSGLVQHKSEYKADRQNAVCFMNSDELDGDLSVKAEGSGHFVWRGLGSVVRNSKLSVKGKGNSVFLGPFSKLIDADIRLSGDGAVFYFGAFSTDQSMTVLIEGPGEIVIGDGSMLSARVILDCSDHHGIYDLSTGERVNRDANIFLAPRVWIGRDVRVNKGVYIGSETVVGQSSVVSGRLDGSSIYAGAPARKLRDGVTWSRAKAADLEAAKRSPQEKVCAGQRLRLQGRLVEFD